MNDDVALFRLLLDHLIGAGIADPARIYVTGFSNGGLMTLRLGCDMAERLAGIVPVAASLPATAPAGCAPSAPLPVLLINGTADPLIPYIGGAATYGGVTVEPRLSAEATASFFAMRNGCGSEVTTDATAVLTTRTYVDCPAVGEVVQLAVQGGGHSWPVGPDVDAGRLVWGFLRRHTRP